MPRLNRLLSLALLGLLLGTFASPLPAHAQVDIPAPVEDLFKMKIKGGDQYFAFESAAAGNDTPAQEAGGFTLEYEVGAAVGLSSKIVVETDCPGQQFSLQTRAENISSTLGGTPVGPVDLVDGAPPADFIRDILPVSVKTKAELVYRAQALMSQGFGRDDHTVTYTLLAQ